ncbi:tripartite motif-containing protein 16-like isoform X3 [Scleropages formosus]|uniref:tripartite motif-containing protein 16-like isoform X3 n=1 Tax=Scleropages formosus TaxID=113540 RepID=UPI0010FA674E|nr:tripartite motif-containing protein 16-like isoform X3 [Scleropages formosus]
MAQAADLEQIQFSCSICLDLLKDPVTVPCGHSYCMDCIKGCWDQEDDAGVYSCPQCRQSFTSRPVLGRNTLLAEVMEKLKKTELQAAPFDGNPSTPGAVECDFCIGRKEKAVKSCLVCLASYCESHLQPHYESATFKKHKLIDATGQLQDKICSLHDKVLEIYCRTDQQCICYLCTMDEHRGHDTVSAASGRTEKQKYLETMQKQFLQRMKEKEKRLQQLRQAVESLTSSAQAAVEDTERIFTEMIRSLEKRCSELKDVIRAQEKAELSQAEGLQKQLEQDIAVLKRRNTEMQQLLETEDHVHFLQNFQSVSHTPESEIKPSITINPDCSFANIKKSVSKLTVQLEDIWRKELEKISGEVKGASVVLPLEPKTREDFLKSAYTLTLDPNTANARVILSDGNTSASVGDPQQYPDHPERFDSHRQVLCTEGLSGRSYWEVQWSGDAGVHIAVSYKGINREGGGNDCGFGLNDKSWSLFCSPSSCSFYHNNVVCPVSGPSSSTIGVYLDHRAGALSFYSVSKDTMTLLHRVQTTFPEPLYPGFLLLSHAESVYSPTHQLLGGKRYSLNEKLKHAYHVAHLSERIDVGSKIHLV